MVLWIGLKFPLSLGVLDSFYYSWWETFRLGNSIFFSTPPLFLLDTLCYTHLEKIETHPHSHNFYSIKMSEMIPFGLRKEYVLLLELKWYSISEFGILFYYVVCTLYIYIYIYIYISVFCKLFSKSWYFIHVNWVIIIYQNIVSSIY